jgi:hypothetical protein
VKATRSLGGGTHHCQCRGLVLRCCHCCGRGVLRSGPRCVLGESGKSDPHNHRRQQAPLCRRLGGNIVLSPSAGAAKDPRDHCQRQMRGLARAGTRARAVGFGGEERILLCFSLVLVCGHRFRGAAEAVREIRAGQGEVIRSGVK